MEEKIKENEEKEESLKVEKEQTGKEESRKDIEEKVRQLVVGDEGSNRNIPVHHTNTSFKFKPIRNISAPNLILVGVRIQIYPDPNL